jgi:hypothetical protein
MPLTLRRLCPISSHSSCVSSTSATAFPFLTVHLQSHPTACVWILFCYCISAADCPFVISHHSLCVNPPLPLRSCRWPSMCDLIPQPVRESLFVTVFPSPTIRVWSHPAARAWIHLCCHCIQITDHLFALSSNSKCGNLPLLLHSDCWPLFALLSHSKCVNPRLTLHSDHWLSIYNLIPKEVCEFFIHCVRTTDCLFAISSHSKCMNFSLPLCSHCSLSDCNIIP